jgi:molybdopterin converting factor small subunit
MPVSFFLSSPLRPFAGGASRVDLADASPRTAGEALDQLFRSHPPLRDRVLDERGELRPHVNVFVGNESVRYTGGLATPLAGPCEISILPAVSGGLG